MDDKDTMQARAETAPTTQKPKASVLSIVDRAKRNDGHGLTPSEVMALARVVEHTAELFREYERGVFASHRFVVELHALIFCDGAR